MYMGPVSFAVMLYVADRFVSRVLKRQLFRRGLRRKVVRLAGMITSWDTMSEMAFDLIEDIMTQ